MEKTAFIRFTKPKLVEKWYKFQFSPSLELNMRIKEAILNIEKWGSNTIYINEHQKTPLRQVEAFHVSKDC